MSRTILTFLAYENDFDVADELTQLKLYLNFVHSAISLLNVSIKQAISKYIWITEMYSVFVKLRKEFLTDR